MLEVNGITSVRKVHWNNLKPGMILIGGFTINDTIPYELRHFPVLTNQLLNDLNSKYNFLKSRTFSVADADPGFNSKEISDHINCGLAVFKKLIEFSGIYNDDKKKVLKGLGLNKDLDIPILGSGYVERKHMVLDRYNSFVAPIEKVNLEGLPEGQPTFIDPNMELKMTLAELVTGRVSTKLNLPDDKDVTLHLAVDYSFSMNQLGKLDIVISALHNFYNYISEFLLNTRIKLYVFSDTCMQADYPLSGREVERKATNYSTFMKKVLHHRDPDRYNKVILFTDGQPSDHTDALAAGEKMKKQGIDYTQIIFSIDEEIRKEVIGENLKTVDGFAVSDEGHETRVLNAEELEIKKKGIFKTFTRVAEVCGGNQVIITANALARLVAVECYDRYMGMLTLATREETEQVLNETYEHKGKQVRKWEFGKM